jgi:hypothetical protein
MSVEAALGDTDARRERFDPYSLHTIGGESLASRIDPT